MCGQRGHRAAGCPKRGKAGQGGKGDDGKEQGKKGKAGEGKLMMAKEQASGEHERYSKGTAISVGNGVTRTRIV